ncbi:2-phospho-L-lactate guanylyltransferase [Phytoactinopolyspora halotolerans]|uniref:Phosphoenolpyruvate guanylyltransferase n=1 Tax=Phytoactinopolyspora halotolerans TaxID=1981512 RepID=A0A6L9SGR8_9ACTN|nr:2-phospho-L-lactate guanylyltransferase [Phytoactinopolyspora halotolerans]NEE03622.1 2-phospho-L-lactate guanylyltransferase [Phytoactinopolyspora halotolerans]
MSTEPVPESTPHADLDAGVNSDAAHAGVRWSIVVPVKRPEYAKTRLADAVGEFRPHVARAFAADTIAAALACTVVSTVTVVTDDEEAAAEARTLGAAVIADTPASGLNAALRHGAATVRTRRPDAAVASLSADLPALRADELKRVLTAATMYPTSFLADAVGIGTTLYACLPGAEFDPRFGGRSRAAHRAAGAVELDVPGVPSVRRDIDTAVDLWDAMRIGLGPRTESVIVQLDAAF